MNRNELDAFLRTVTKREQFYLDHPGAESPTYKNMEHRTIDGKDVLYFRLPALREAEILIRKDSRFTDVPYYIHSNLNMHYIYSGKCDMIIDDQEITLHQGDVGIFDTGVVRRKLYAGEDDIIINISMSNEFLNDSFLRDIGSQRLIFTFILHVLSQYSTSHNHYMLFRTNQNAEISTLFTQLLLEYYSSRIYGKDMIKGYLYVIFVELMRLYYEDSANQLVQISSSGNQNIVDILSYLERHFADCTLTELSERFGYHPKYLSSLLKKQTGHSFKELQLNQRLQEAARLLIESDEPIQNIFEKVGASNQTYFYKSFEKKYQMSPKNYRRKSRRP